MKIRPLRIRVAVRLAIVAGLIAACGLAFPGTGLAQGSPPSFELVHGFEAVDVVAGGPAAPPITGPDGLLYGTTARGGEHGYGSIFRIQPDGTQVTLHSFRGRDGRYPVGRLAFGPDGTLYGVTTRGGTLNQGAIFIIDRWDNFMTIHSFGPGASFGVRPLGGLVLAPDGFVYGTTSAGVQPWEGGTIFKIVPNGVEDVRRFGSRDEPRGDLLLLPDGKLCGANYRNEWAEGTVYCYDLGGFFFTVHTFLGSPDDGGSPTGPLTLGADGRLYGTTEAGGAHGRGVAYGVRPDPFGDPQAYQVVFHFDDSAGPASGLIQGADGAFYGTRRAGGVEPGGVLFRLDGQGHLSILHSFPEGADPRSGLVLGADGLFYGTTAGGGTGSGGTVYRTDSLGALQTLHSFPAARQPLNPSALLSAADGHLYGVTELGGEANLGTIFRVSADGAVTVLHSFSGTDGAEPRAGLIQTSDGAFYGTTALGGQSDLGTVFRFEPAGTLTVLHSFAGGFFDGGEPEARLLQASDGLLYGATSGGAFSPGTVFSVDPAIGLTRSLFGGVGAGAVSGLIEAADGFLYGTTEKGGILFFDAGTVFRLQPGGDERTTVHSFSHTDGAHPRAPLFQDVDGLLYGTTSSDGFASDGTVFQINSAGRLQTLFQFHGSNGARPHAPLVRGVDGRLYGVTREGGDSDKGTIFVRDLLFGFQTVHSFDGANGELAEEGLTPAPDGFLYGTTAAGGPGGGGVIYRLRLQYSDLSVTKTGTPDTVVEGGEITYTLTVTNQGPSEATQIELQDSPAPGLVLVSAPPECSAGPAMVSCFIPSLAPGTSTTIELRFQAWAPGGTTVTNQAAVFFFGLDPDDRNNRAETTTAVVAPRVEVSAPGAGVVWAVGSTRAITWSHNFGPSAVFHLRLVRGFDQEPIAFDVPAETATTGRYEWTVTGPPSANATIHVETGPMPAASGVFAIAEAFPAAAETYIQTVSGNGSRVYDGEDRPPTEAGQDPTFVAFRDDFGLPIFTLGDGANHRLRSFTPGGYLFSDAGDGTEGYTGDGGPAGAAQVGRPSAGVWTLSGQLFFADETFGVVRRIDRMSADIIQTVAGTGTNGYGGDGGPATSALLDGPRGVAVDGDGNVFVADTRNHRIRRVDALTGVIETIAGNGVPGDGGDGGPAASSQVSSPAGLALDADGNLYLADSGNHRVRRIALATGIITTVAAGLSSPQGVAVDAGGHLLIADTGNHRIRRVDAATEIIDTVAGEGTPGFAGDGGRAAAARLDGPLNLIVDPRGRLFVTDAGNARVRRVAPVDSEAAVVIEDGRTTVSPGGEVLYTIVVANGGPKPLDSLRVTSELTEATSASWTCTPMAGASCAPSGGGPLIDYPSLPPGTNVVYALRVVVNPEATGTLNLTVRLTPPDDFTDPSANNQATDVNTIAAVRVTAPDSAVEWRIADARTIRWTQTLPEGATLRVELSRSGLGGLWEVLGTAPASAGAFAWTVSGPPSAGAQARVRVSWTDDASVTDASDAGFTILDRLTITAPAAGAVWRVGQREHVHFGHNVGAGQWVLLELSWNGGATYWPVSLARTTVAAGLEDVSLLVLGPVTDHARVRVTWLAPQPLVRHASEEFRIVR